MQKVETAYHFITSSENDKPKYVCKGPCKKVYWDSDYRDISPVELIKCVSCNGNIKSASKEDYKLVEFKITPQHTKQAVMGYMSQVKQEFVEYAKATWAS